MAARDDSRRDAEYEDIARNGIERDDNARGDGGHEALALGDGAARAGNDHDGARRYDDTGHDGPVHADLDALMAALLDDPLPEEALRDAEFMAARDAAAADVALLREQLGIIGEALAATGDDAVAGAPPGRPAAARPGDAAGAQTDPGRVSRTAPAPTASVTPLLPRPDRARRALKITFGSLAAAAAASVVLGVGWGVMQNGGAAGLKSSSDSGASDESASRDGSKEDNRDGAASVSPEGYVACTRLIVEGIVTEVEPANGGSQDRITVEVNRWIKPDKGGDQVVFPMDHDVDPRLKKGDHVLVGIPRDGAYPDVWTTEEAEIARDRAWMEEALPGSEKLSCE